MDLVSDQDDLETIKGLWCVSFHDIVLSGTNTTHGLDLYGSDDSDKNYVELWNIFNHDGSDVVLRWNLDNVVVGGVTGTITIDGLSHDKIFFRDRKRRGEGIATFSGDGSTTEFKIEHGLVSTPSKYGVSPLTPDAHADKTISVDSTYITITFSTAPPSGTDNLKFSWWAEV